MSIKILTKQKKNKTDFPTYMMHASMATIRTRHGIRFTSKLGAVTKVFGAAPTNRTIHVFLVLVSCHCSGLKESKQSFDVTKGKFSPVIRFEIKSLEKFTKLITPPKN